MFLQFFLQVLNSEKWPREIEMFINSGMKEKNVEVLGSVKQR